MVRMKRVRDFSKVPDVVEIPNLNAIQRNSYTRFLQADVDPRKRKAEGLEALLREIFSIDSYDGQTSLEYLYYELGEPRYNRQECRDLRLTYGLPFRLCCRLVRKDVKEIKEELIYIGEIPVMIGGGEFIINGAERVIVSQLHRSPGVDFSVVKEQSDRPLHGARIIPERGSWVELTVTKKDSLTIRIDQSSKIPATMFLRAMDEKYGETADIIREFHKTKSISTSQLRPLMYLVEEFVDPDTGEVLVPAGGQVGEAMTAIVSSSVKKLEVVVDAKDPLILNTLVEDPSDRAIDKESPERTPHERALLRLYARLRPGNPAKLEKAKALFAEKFYDENRYRLGKVGRFRVNRKFSQDIPETAMTLRVEDFVNTLKYLMLLRDGNGSVDDIDHLGNRRLRTIDELATEELRKGFLKLRRTAQERMSLKDISELTKVAELINSKSLSSSIDYFFARSELSQVVDQQNPLAQLKHERTLSALGSGGLNRKRAGFEVRDVHISHYGRICPIETPEGNNIGLISSLGIYGGVDEYGFLTTPYRKAYRSKVSDEIVHLRADQEMELVLAPPDALERTDKGVMNRLPAEHVLARARGEVLMVDGNDVDYIDISPRQTVGISASLIPFLEHDDANRALMGSNMQRQAVPLIRTEAPIIATGMEGPVIENSSFVVKAEKAGTVTCADAKRIVINDTDEYELRKFAKLNERACLNQRPVVDVGQRVKKGQIIADGSASDGGQLALGQNCLVAFMTFDGYNFEDAILISERMLKTDAFTSIHLEEYSVEIRETKLGREEFTRDIPNVSERALKDLDENGIVLVGTRVGPGGILVGKVAPKSKSELSPEEKLLHAIFGRAGEDVKNDSLELPAGEEGIVVDTRRFSRRMHMSDDQKKQVRSDIRAYEKRMRAKMIAVFRTMAADINEVLGKPMVDPNTLQKVGQSDSDAIIWEQVEVFEPKWIKGGPPAAKQQALDIYDRYWPRLQEFGAEMERKLGHMKRGDELPSGVLEMVKVRVATKRTLGVGDKMAGRHGNKGVIARILPEEDMPFLADGTPVDVCLNPLGVPGRMNLGQILETHLGWAASILGFQAVTPVFSGATEGEIFKCIEEANEHIRKRRGMPLTAEDRRKLALCEKYGATKKEREAASAELESIEEDRNDWIEKNYQQWRKKYLSEVIAEYAYVDIEDLCGRKLTGRELEAIEKALIVSGDFADRQPRPHKAKKGQEGFVPRFNAWPWGNDGEKVRREARAAVNATPEVKEVYGHCRKTMLGQIRSDRKRSGDTSGVPDSQGIYFFFNKQTGRVNEGYIGLAGIGQKQMLLGRLRMHFAKGPKTFQASKPDHCPDQLIKRYADEEEYQLRQRVKAAPQPGEIEQAKKEEPQLREKQALAAKYPGDPEVVRQAGETRELLDEMPHGGKVTLFDGRTGEPFEQRVTVGYIYMMKLHHLVDEKIHARATGPYSLITQQPLGGKARTGGQRFGEMEVWGLEAYGASYTLQELLTVKSDDVEGRTKIYESMVKGTNTLEAGTPVSFDVLCNELRGLGLNIQLEKKRLI